MSGRGTMLLLLLLLVAPSGRAESSAELYNLGNDHYREGRFKEARAAYEEALAAGLRHPDLYYNLAAAELKLERPGRALLHLVRASELRPRDPEIRDRLRVLRGQVRSLPREDESSLSRAFVALSGFYSANEWTALLLAGYWALALAVTAFIIAVKPGARRAWKTTALSLAAVLALALPFAGARIHHDLYAPRAIVVEPNPPARGPDLAEEKDCGLSEGMEIKVARCHEGWCRIKTREGAVCWIPGASFERIFPLN